METIQYTPKAAEPKPAPYHKIMVNWSHGFQHSLVCTGNTLMAQLKDLEGMFYVKEVLHHEITRKEYEDFYSTPLGDFEDPAAGPVEKKSRIKKTEPKNSPLKFSSLDNFFGNENTVEKKSSRRKK
jgi:hypothetical protein